MGRPYLYHYVQTFPRSHQLSLNIARKELHDAGFEMPSPPVAWEQFALNADTLVVVTTVPLEGGTSYVHVLATSNEDASAKQWGETLMQRIADSKMVAID